MGITLWNNVAIDWIYTINANGNLSLFMEKIHLDKVQACTHTHALTHAHTHLWSGNAAIIQRLGSCMPRPSPHVYSVSQQMAISHLSVCKSLCWAQKALTSLLLPEFSPQHLKQLSLSPPLNKLCACCVESTGLHVGNPVGTWHWPSFQEVCGLWEVKKNKRRIGGAKTLTL